MGMAMDQAGETGRRPWPATVVRMLREHGVRAATVVDA